MTAFTMPSLGADMDEGLLQEWLVRPGDRVHKGDVMAVVETDKAAIEVECFDSGTVARLLVEPGTRVPVGTPLALLDDQAVPDVRTGAARGPAAAGADRVPAGSAGPATEAVASTSPTPAAVGRVPVARHPRPAPQKAAARRPEAIVEPAGSTSRKDQADEHVHTPPGSSGGAVPVIGAGPLVRHLAVLRGVDLTAVHGTGRGGRITRADVEHAQPTRAPRVRATPYARRIAQELGVELAAVRGTGDGGAVRAADVRAAVRTPAGGEKPGRPDRGPLNGDRGPLNGERGPDAAIRSHSRAEDRTESMRRAIADLMSRSKREIPHYYLSTTIDLTTAEDWLRRINRSRTPTERLLPAALLLKAAAVAAREVPALNGSWQDGAFAPASEINLGVAVSLRQGGLLAPVIRNADTLPPDALMTRLKELVRRARRGRLRGTEMTGATLTVTSLGDQGVEAVFGVIHPPQVALVGFGAVVERPWAAGGMLGVRPVVTATLAADHRATDGAVGARYLTAVDRLLQNPEEL
ncbi:dihydrolipoamide acetyltransferase family protein [Streptomyces collinus]|uniref:dihydrolipoamide acetyltransferase family protein n=1 Tax=Streptomyces collinus TaxID=42684 RepID=UPI002942D6E3|nr:dihydrolipoamide acetyltransferase family protein [Streptomyces collinus]